MLTGLCILLPLPWLYVVNEDQLLRNREQRLAALEYDAAEVLTSKYWPDRLETQISIDAP
jgi:YD repeat-containing protein